MINIKIERETRKVYLDRAIIGNDNENLQDTLQFTFDEFVNGAARLDYLLPDGANGFLPMQKVEESYTIPLKDVLMKEGLVYFQLVVTETEQESGIPRFKSNKFHFIIGESINAETEAPEQYETWIDIIEEKIAEVENIDIDVETIGEETKVIITKKDGTKKEGNIPNPKTLIKDVIVNDESVVSEDNIARIDLTKYHDDTKVDKIEGKVLSSNDYTNEEKQKLADLKNYDDADIRNQIEQVNDLTEQNERDIINLNNKITSVDEDIEDIEETLNHLDDTKADKTELPDVSEFVKKTVNDLTNYYLKSETYTQQEVNQLIGAIKTVSMKVLPERPQTGEANIIYLIPSAKSTTENIYDEYIYVNNTWELIGSTKVDLTDYYTKQEINTLLFDYVTSNDLEEILNDYATKNELNNKVDKEDGKGLSTNDFTDEYKTKLDNVKNSKVVEIGSYQYSYEGTVLPAIPVEIARQIYVDDKEGIFQILHWTLYGTENNLKVVSSDFISSEYSLDVLIHNKYHCEYKWTNETTGNINPTIQAQEGGLVDDVKVNGQSVVQNKVANIDLSNYATIEYINSLNSNEVLY